METVLPGVILDGAHNDSGVEEFVKTARKFQKDTKLTLLFSCVKEKDYDGMIRTICESLDFESVVVTQIDTGRFRQRSWLRSSANIRLVRWKRYLSLMMHLMRR